MTTVSCEEPTQGTDADETDLTLTPSGNFLTATCISEVTGISPFVVYNEVTTTLASIMMVCLNNGYQYTTATGDVIEVTTLRCAV
ncbi:hypothetical protein L5515_011598 [Caenorhabditis briggsae]|uniref:Uncharacterized protein n=1 Tax=Caenorhabditis briggsae TaxID=6238 RepID=A0AAE9EQA4_CAEBR|nr:hypothetical protein L5515_011598 [Caenorhabditis briggsae]